MTSLICQVFFTLVWEIIMPGKGARLEACYDGLPYVDLSEFVRESLPCLTAGL